MATKQKNQRVPEVQKHASKAEAAKAAVLAELRPGQSIELLKELHILTRDGGAQPGLAPQA